MDIGLSFTFPFSDSDWFKKLILVGLVGLIPIIGQFVVMGFMGQVITRYIHNDAELLPDLDFGGQLSLGFKLFIVSFVYFLPVFIFLIPTWIIAPIAASMGDAGNDSASAMLIFLSIFSFCCGSLAILYAICINFLVPIAYTRVALEETIGAGFKFSEIFAILKANLVNYLIALLLTAFAGGAIMSVGSMVCVVGVIFAMPYAFAMQGNLYGQAYKIAQSKQVV